MTIITEGQIPLFRLIVLRSGIEMEGKGLRLSRGRSCLAIAKSEFGWKGGRASILEKLNGVIDSMESDSILH
jgi:hypothetical protein